MDLSITLSELEQLDNDQKVEALKSLRATYKVSDIRKGLGFPHNNAYYMWLKKHKIYDQVTKKYDLSIPLDNDRRSIHVPSLPIQEEIHLSNGDIQLDVQGFASGVATSKMLQKYAALLSDQPQSVHIRISITSR
ncbi:hypothetical protein [Paenibacillus arenosi]|uniref:Transposase n=1 Tax=Paenibacillus arenosi TaxID=2774142 RepID=A0ABR9AYU5_9BACL|nr:hypothetical protein [Paenibacillus arenosi]MBD8498096.1 hypothetical protein [Paenibacillus arenosi]